MAKSLLAVNETVAAGASAASTDASSTTAETNPDRQLRMLAM
jgi:hypothetical protein